MHLLKVLVIQVISHCLYTESVSSPGQYVTGDVTEGVVDKIPVGGVDILAVTWQVGRLKYAQRCVRSLLRHETCNMSSEVSDFYAKCVVTKAISNKGERLTQCSAWTVAA